MTAHVLDRRRRHRVNKTASVLVMAISAVSVLAGCAGEDPYCAAVKQHRSALESFGGDKTSADFTREAKAIRQVASTAPDGSKDDWAAVGAAMDRVLKVHKKAGVTLQDMRDVEKVAAAEQDDLDAIREALEAFNGTADRRAAMVKDVKDVCDITLK
jgi:hypothetical protein